MSLRLLGCAYAVFALVAPGRLPTMCPYRRLTGRRCPACGLTSAVGAVLRGDVRRAVRLHPLGLPVAVGLCVVVSCGPRRAVPAAPRPAPPSPPPPAAPPPPQR